MLASAGVLGFTDVDAPTISMIRLGQQASEVQLAVTAIVVAILSNTILKTILALVLGSPAYR